MLDCKVSFKTLGPKNATMALTLLTPCHNLNAAPLVI